MTIHFPFPSIFLLLSSSSRGIEEPSTDCSILFLSGSGFLTTLLGGAGSLGLGLDLGGLGTVVLAHGSDDAGLLLGLDDGNGVGQGLGRAGLALGVGAAHDLDLDAEDTLAQEDVTGGAVDEVTGGLAGVDHEAVGELHGLGTGGAQLAGDDDLAALGAGLHDEAEDTVAGTTDGEAVEELVAQGLALGDGGQAAVLDLGGVEGDGVLGELEALLDEGGELADAAPLLAEDLLGVGGADDDVGDGGRDAHLDARVALLGQLALEELVQLGVEDAVGDELSALGTVEAQTSQYGVPQQCKCEAIVKWKYFASLWRGNTIRDACCCCVANPKAYRNRTCRNSYLHLRTGNGHLDGLRIAG